MRGKRGCTTLSHGGGVSDMLQLSVRVADLVSTSSRHDGISCCFSNHAKNLTIKFLDPENSLSDENWAV